MSIIKKIFAGFSALALAITFTACNKDTSWANKVEGEKINAGIYIFYTLEGYDDAYSKLSSDSSVTKDNIMTKEIDGKKVPEYIQEYATDKCKQIVSVNKKFDELGLTLSDTDKKAIKFSVDNEWEAYGKYYTKNGISKKSIEIIQTMNQKLEVMFYKYYDKGGIEEVSQEDINKEIAKNVARVKILPLILKNDDGSALTDTQKADLKKKAEEYIERVKNGEDFNEIINKYYEEKYDNSTLLPELNPKMNNSTEDDKYENETIVYKGHQYIDPDAVTKMIELDKYNEPTFIDSTTYYYVVVKLDIAEREDVLEQYRKSALIKIKNDEFEKLAASWGENYKVEKNDDSYKRYAPEKVIKKMRKIQEDLAKEYA